MYLQICPYDDYYCLAILYQYIYSRDCAVHIIPATHIKDDDDKT